MQLRTLSFVVVLALAASTGFAQTGPGVGYDPQARGFSTSRYQLDTLLTPFLSYQAVFTARPDLAGANPNPYYLDFSDAAVRAAIELRWGPETSTSRFKRWAGPGATVRLGKPFRLKKIEGRLPREALRKMTDEALYRLAAMLPEQRRGIYADLSKATSEYIE